MNLSDFRASLTGEQPPRASTAVLQALWWAAKGDWEKAHKIVMGKDSLEASWVHAYLHRVEGDLPNAGYWYRQAKRAAATGALEAEWADISTELLRTTGTS